MTDGKFAEEAWVCVTGLSDWNFHEIDSLKSKLAVARQTLNALSCGALQYESMEDMAEEAKEALAKIDGSGEGKE